MAPKATKEITNGLTIHLPFSIRAYASYVIGYNVSHLM
jgi:hypothetical protein